MPRKKKSSPTDEARITGIVGLGLDSTDDQKRITRTEEMVLMGGSAETHERMQETAIRFAEALEQIGKSLPEVSARQAIDLLREAHEKTR